MKNSYNILKTLLVAFIATASSVTLQAQIITTFAGDGTGNYAGDGGAATAAQCYYPNDVAFDGSGNVFIADALNNVIRKVNASGTITTIGGTGYGAGYWSGAFSGDGGAATAATFNMPSGIAIDASNNIYIADNCNSRIRKIDASGTITTIAGSGTAGYGGGGYGGDGGPATAARLNFPTGVNIDGSGNIYIADAGNHRIRKISTSGIITTIAGTSTWGYSGDGGPATAAKLSMPNCILPDGSGNLYIADYDNQRVRKINASGIITTIAGNGTGGYSGDGGAATAAKLFNPAGLAFDAAGNLFIADSYNSRIRKVTPAGIISTFAGTGSFGYSGDGGGAAAAQLMHPCSVKISGTDVYVADSLSNAVRKISVSTTSTPVSASVVKSKIDVYPNPSHGSFNVNITSMSKGDAAIEIINSKGEVVKALSTPVTIGANNIAELKLNIPPGVYYTTVLINGEKTSGKILIE